MIRRSCQAIAGLVVACLLSSTSSAVDRVEMRPGDVIERSSGGFGYTIELISPLTQSYPVLDFLGPYYYMLLTNTSGSADDFSLSVNNLTPGGWFPQVCLRAICFPDSTTLNFAPGEADTIGVNVVPFTEEMGEWDFSLASLGDPGLNDTFHMVLYVGAAATGVNGLSASDGFRLAQSYPNPAPGRTSISFTLPREQSVSLGLYDVAGRLVARLADGPHAAGVHTVRWDGTREGVPASPGVYFYRLSTPAGELSKSLTLVR